MGSVFEEGPLTKPPPLNSLKSTSDQHNLLKTFATLGPKIEETASQPVKSSTEN